LKLPSCCADILPQESKRVDFSWGYNFHYSKMCNPSPKLTQSFQLITHYCWSGLQYIIISLFKNQYILNILNVLYEPKAKTKLITIKMKNNYFKLLFCSLNLFGMCFNKIKSIRWNLYIFKGTKQKIVWYLGFFTNWRLAVI
jgi:hypothetical protein